MTNAAIEPDRRILVHSATLGSYNIEKRQGNQEPVPIQVVTKGGNTAGGKQAVKKDKKKKKKKKKNQRFGPPGTRDIKFKGPLINPASFPGLELEPIQGPWRHSITYAINWSFDPSKLQEFMYSHLTDEDRTWARVPPQGPYVMDVMLYPLEPGKTVELLLTNVPLTAPEAPNQAQNGTLKIPLRTDVSFGWYRLEIQIWDMGYRHQPDDSEMTPAEIEEQDWRMSKEVAATSAAAVDTTIGAELAVPASIQRTFWSIASWIVSGPGRSRLQKSSTTAATLGNRGREDDGAAQSAATKASHYIENSFYNKRRVAAWRGTEAIEVTTLSHDDPEWNEFMRNSRENLQDRLNHLHADDPAQLAHMLELAHHDTVEYREAAKEYRMPRPYLQFDANEGIVTELDENESGVNDPFTSPIIAIPSPPSAVRTVYDQDLFRYRKEISIVFSRIPPPEPELDEDDLAEIEAAKPEAEKLKEARDREHLEHWVQSWFGSAVNEGEDKLNKMAQSQIEERGEETPFVVSQDFSGAGQLQIRIEYMNRVLSNERLFTVPANADRVVSWETPDNLLDDKVIFALELVQLPPEYILSTNNQSPEAVRSSLLRKALNVPHTALIADRIPASWGAISIRIPSHVTQGPYQIRLHGISKDGRRWADVSQPFMVLNDPFIYSYPPF